MKEILRDLIAQVIQDAIPDTGTTTFEAVADEVIEALSLTEFAGMIMGRTHP